MYWAIPVETSEDEAKGDAIRQRRVDGLCGSCDHLGALHAHHAAVDKQPQLCVPARARTKARIRDSKECRGGAPTSLQGRNNASHGRRSEQHAILSNVVGLRVDGLQGARLRQQQMRRAQSVLLHQVHEWPALALAV